MNSIITYFQGPDGVIDFRSYIQSDWNTYLDSISRDGEWADAVVLVAMAHMLRRDILVVTSSPEGTGDKAIKWIVGDSNFKGTPIRLGHVWEQHYISLGIHTRIQQVLLAMQVVFDTKKNAKIWLFLMSRRV